MQNIVIAIGALVLVGVGLFFGLPYIQSSQSGSASVSSSSVPKLLDEIEANAEDIIDVAPNGQWDTISADINNIEQAWKTYQTPKIRKTVDPKLLTAMNSAIVELRSQATSQDVQKTMQAANNSSAAVVELFDLYHPKVPTDIGRLDMLERQVVLDGNADQWGAVSQDLQRIQTVWDRIKAQILTHKGQKVSTQFEGSLATQGEASSAKNLDHLIKEASSALELVDGMEKVFA